MDQSPSKREFENLCHNIIWPRKSYGLSKKKMSTILRIGAQSLNKLESFEIPPRLSVEILFLLYKHFHIPPWRLLASQLEEGEDGPQAQQVKGNSE